MRISGITIPENKRLDIGLTAIYGIGRSRAATILAEAGVPVSKRSKELTPEEENQIRAVVEKIKIEGDLKRLVQRKSTLLHH
jgi:small subunit ribosomal protein S13